MKNIFGKEIDLKPGLSSAECSAVLKDARARLKTDFDLIHAPVPTEEKAKTVKKTYSGSDASDGVIINKPPRSKNTELYLPYKPNKNTVQMRVVNEEFPFGTPVVEKHGQFYVVRDDLLTGGTKSRMIMDLIRSGNNKEWVYATPAQGYAQIAIALCCAAVGKKAVIYVAKSEKMHRLTEIAWRAGAEIRMVPMGFLSNVSAKAARYVQQNSRATLVPFGADHPSTIESLARSIRQIEIKPKEVWSVCSTGTLSRGLQNAWPKAVHKGVMVGHIPTQRQRGFCEVFIAPERYEQNARVLPPFPSAINYDAKVWRFIQEFGKKNALFWNVGA